MESNDPIHGHLAKADIIVGLIKKQIDGAEKLTPAEEKTLQEWLAASPHNREVYNDLSNPDTLESEMKKMVGGRKVDLWQKINKAAREIRKPGILSFFSSRVGKYAAVIAVLLIGAGAYFLFIKESKDNKPVADQNQQPTITPDLQPGKDRAVLQLADGSTIILDEANNGFVSKQGGADISKKDGELNYSIVDPASMANHGVNTLRIPKGGKWTLDLSDGSRVFLNAESSIVYPVVFNGDSREVTVNGEAYFEVAKDAKRPFRVTTKNMTVEVLGTHFNLNSYGDEDAVQTTLLEGAVRSRFGDEQITLRPGQQCILNTSGKLKLNTRVDIEKVMAWKDNSFHFQDDNIENIMKQLARWYNVDIVYEGKVFKKYTGIISRDVKVSEIFHLLELSGGVKCSIDGKKIIVRPN
jgi:transmembrane sensor